MLFFGVVQHQAKAHTFARLFPIRERAHAGQHCGDPGVGIGQNLGAGFAAFGPLRGNPFQIADQQIAGRAQVFTATVAIVIGAGLALSVIGPGAGTRSGAVAIQILTPQQKFDGVIAGGDIGLDPICLVQGFGQKGRGDGRCVNGFARQIKAGLRNHIQRGQGVFIRRTAIGAVDVINQALVQGPGVHLAFPIIDDGIAETVDLGLLIRHASGKPCGFRGFKRFGRGRVDQGVDRRLQGAGGDQAIAIFGMGDIGIGGQNRLFAGRIAGKGRGGPKGR